METTLEEKRTVTVAEASRILGISERHGYNMVRAGELPAIRLGARILVPVQQLERLLAAEGLR